MACLWNISWMHGHARKRAQAKWRGWRITWICDSYNGMRDQMLNNIWPQDELRRGNAKTSTTLGKKSCVLQKFGTSKPSFALYWTVPLTRMQILLWLHSVLYNFQILFPKTFLPVTFPWFQVVSDWSFCSLRVKSSGEKKFILELRNIYIHYRNIHEFKVL